jgi:hypothetical protein
MGLLTCELVPLVMELAATVDFYEDERILGGIPCNIWLPRGQGDAAGQQQKVVSLERVSTTRHISSSGCCD